MFTIVDSTFCSSVFFFSSWRAGLDRQLNGLRDLSGLPGLRMKATFQWLQIQNLWATPTVDDSLPCWPGEWKCLETGAGKGKGTKMIKLCLTEIDRLYREISTWSMMMLNMFAKCVWFPGSLNSLRICFYRLVTSCNVKQKTPSMMLPWCKKNTHIKAVKSLAQNDFFLFNMYKPGPGSS